MSRVDRGTVRNAGACRRVIAKVPAFEIHRARGAVVPRGPRARRRAEARGHPGARVVRTRSTEGGGRGPADALARFLCFRRGVVVVQDPEFSKGGERVAAAGDLGGRGARECREVRVDRIVL